MAAEAALFRDFAVVVLAAGAVALLFYYLKQPVVLGYLLAGFIVGPYSPGPSFVSDAGVMAFLGELGIVFLLFALGLEFSLKKLRKVGATAILAGTLEIAFMLALGYSIGRGFGWTPMQSVFLGAIMSISSTTIIVKVLGELGHKDEDWAQTAFGILIIEDILAVLILTALSGAGATGSFQAEAMLGLVYKLGIFLGAALLLGVMFAPRLVDRLAVIKVEEVMVILAAGLGFGMALLAQDLGFSAGLGAFVAGALMAESPRVAKITHRIEPMRDVFTAIFFVTVGAALDPLSLVANWGIIAVVTTAVVLGKIVGVTLATFATGAAPGKALRVGMTLAQIGEFAFIIAVLGVQLGAASPSLYAVAIAVSALSAFLTPYLVRASPRVVAAFERRMPAGLQAYLRSYGAWVRRVGRSERTDPLRREVRNNVLTASLLLAVIIAVFGIGNVFADAIREALAGRFGPQVAALGLEWLLISVVATPFVFMWVRETKQIVECLARMAVPPRLRQAVPTQTERLLRRTFGFLATVFSALLGVLVGGLFIENVLYVAIVAGVGVAIGSVVLGASLKRFHSEVERTIERLTVEDADAAPTRAHAMSLLGESSAWGAGSREVTLPAVSGAGRRTIGQLRLRELTGASVVSVQRRGQSPVVNPGAELRFEPGDHVLLLGEEASLLRAEEILLGRDLGIEGGATEIAIGAGSALPGALVKDLPLGSDLLLLVVRRGAQTLEADDALALREGDVLVLSGGADGLARVREAAGAAAPSPDQRR